MCVRSPCTFISRSYSASDMLDSKSIAYRSPTSKVCPPSSSPRHSASSTAPVNDPLVGCAKTT